MKILDVNEFYAEQGGGVRTYVNAKLEAASRAGHEMVIVAPGPEAGETHRFGGKVVWVKGPPMPIDPRYFVLYREQAVRAVIDNEAPDILEGSSPWTAGWFAARYPGTVKRAFVYHQDPVAVYPHTFLDRLMPAAAIDRLCAPYWAYVRRLANHFDKTIVAGEWLAARLRSFGIAQAMCVPFGIDRALFSPELKDEPLRRELLARCGLGPDAALLVTISRHHPEKRLGTLMRAIAELNNAAGQEPARPVGLVVFGDGPMRRRYERLAQGIPGVHLAGFVSDRPWIARCLASADALLHGSAAETFGFVVAEALCSGTPAVVPSRGGAFELVDTSCAESYEPGDIKGCAAAVRRLLARDRAQLGQAASQLAADRVITQSEHFTRLFEAYRALVG